MNLWRQRQSPSLESCGQNGRQFFSSFQVSWPKGPDMKDTALGWRPASGIRITCRVFPDCTYSGLTPLSLPPPRPPANHSGLGVTTDLGLIAFMRGFSSLALLTFGAGSFFAGCGAGSVHCSMLSSFLGLYPLDAHNTILPSFNNRKHLPVSPQGP